MQLNPAEISELIKVRIDDFGAAVDIRNEGTVLSVTDGICRAWPVRCDGRRDARIPGERPASHLRPGAQPRAHSVGAVILGEYEHIGEGDVVKCTGRILEVPVGPELIGRVVNALGQPIDDGARSKQS
jgi:F-type H+-transporting ATPase subunit alpha